mgnify:CR=1 FL=1
MGLPLNIFGVAWEIVNAVTMFEKICAHFFIQSLDKTAKKQLQLCGLLYEYFIDP